MARWWILLALPVLGCTADGHAPTGSLDSLHASVEGSEERSSGLLETSSPPLGALLFVVLREEGALALLDARAARVLPSRIEGLGDLRHATMVFSPWLDAAFVASRDGRLSRIDLESRRVTASRRTSRFSIDTAMGRSGRLVAVAEYRPGGLTFLDTESLRVVARFASGDARVTGVVDAPGGRFVATCMERGEVWVVDTSGERPRIARRVLLGRGDAYDAMITPDGRYYVVGHLGSDEVSVVDLDADPPSVRSLSILPDSLRSEERQVPVKLPHMAAWAWASGRLFVPLVGRPRLAVLDGERLEPVGSVALRGHPVYAQASPDGRRVWVSFSGEGDDAFLQIVDARTLQVVREVEVGRRIYHFEFVGRGGTVAVSANAAGRIVLLDSVGLRPRASLPLPSPSGVFGVRRAFRLGL